MLFNKCIKNIGRDFENFLRVIKMLSLENLRYNEFIISYCYFNYFFNYKYLIINSNVIQHCKKKCMWEVINKARIEKIWQGRTTSDFLTCYSVLYVVGKSNFFVLTG